MPLNAYLTLKGQKQGAIKGPVTQEGREGSILVHSFSNEILSPRDPQSGLPTGKRMHKPIYILKEVDRASPLLWAALVDNENLVAWELKFWTTSTTGKEKLMYTIELVNASIASIREYMPDNEDPAKANLPLLEEISFTYQKIQWTWTEGTVTASDDWETPVA
jgi:type VI secretion system secreted protein Hcp